MKKIFLIFMILLVLPGVFGIKVVREVSSPSINYGAVLDIEIKVSNDADLKKTFLLTERIPANCEMIDPLKEDRTFSRTIRVLEREIEVGPGGIGYFKYSVKPTGTFYQSAPTKIFDRSTGEIIYSSPLKVEVQGKPVETNSGTVVLGGIILVGIGFYLFRKKIF